MDWIDVDIELPPRDGMYEVTNNPNLLQQEGALYYDGIGFSLIDAYRPIRYWRPYNKIEKRYGKLKE